MQRRKSLVLYCNFHFCFIKFLVDNKFHMNSLSVRHMVQSELLLVLFYDHDEAFLEHHLILLNNFDHHLNIRIKNKKRTDLYHSYRSLYGRIMLFFVEIKTRYVNYVHYVHLTIEEDHQQFVYNSHWMEHLIKR